jgi:spore coat protein U-like protein
MFSKFVSSKSVLAAAIVGTVATFAAPAFSQTTVTSILNVSATVQTACAFGTVTSPVASYDLIFGNFAIGGADKTANVAVAVDCASAVPFALTTDKANASRAMAGPGASTLKYELYTNIGMTTEFSTTPALGFTGTGVVGAPIAFTIYGKIPQAGNAGAQLGAHTATETLSLVF